MSKNPEAVRLGKLAWAKKKKKYKTKKWMSMIGKLGRAKQLQAKKV